MRYVALLRGVNVGGKNKVPMAALKRFFEEKEFSNVSTYIASGNVIFDSEKTAGEIQDLLESALPRYFKLDDKRIRVLVLSRNQMRSVVDNKPAGFGEQPQKYHSDAIFLMGVDAERAMRLFDPREGVDRVWAGKGVIYSQRLSAQRTKSRLNKIMAAPEYKSMTIRNWATTTKLLELMNPK